MDVVWSMRSVVMTAHLGILLGTMWLITAPFCKTSYRWYIFTVLVIPKKRFLGSACQGRHANAFNCWESIQMAGEAPVGGPPWKCGVLTFQGGTASGCSWLRKARNVNQPCLMSRSVHKTRNANQPNLLFHSWVDFNSVHQTRHVNLSRLMSSSRVVLRSVHKTRNANQPHLMSSSALIMHTKAEVVSAHSFALVFATQGTQMHAIVGSVCKRLVQHLPSAGLHGNVVS